MPKKTTGHRRIEGVLGVGIRRVKIKPITLVAMPKRLKHLKSVLC